MTILTQLFLVLVLGGLLNWGLLMLARKWNAASSPGETILVNYPELYVEYYEGETLQWALERGLEIENGTLLRKRVKKRNPVRLVKVAISEIVYPTEESELTARIELVVSYPTTEDPIKHHVVSLHGTVHQGRMFLDSSVDIYPEVGIKEVASGDILPKLNVIDSSTSPKVAL